MKASFGLAVAVAPGEIDGVLEGSPSVGDLADGEVDVAEGIEQRDREDDSSAVRRSGYGAAPDESGWSRWEPCLK